MRKQQQQHQPENSRAVLPAGRAGISAPAAAAASPEIGEGVGRSLRKAKSSKPPPPQQSPRGRSGSLAR